MSERLLCPRSWHISVPMEPGDPPARWIMEPCERNFCGHFMENECADVAKVQVLIGIREQLAVLARTAQEQLDIDKAILERGGYDDIQPDAGLVEAVEEISDPLNLRPCTKCVHYDSSVEEEPCNSCVSDPEHPSFEPSRSWNDDEPEPDASEDERYCETCEDDVVPADEEPCLSCDLNTPDSDVCHWRPRRKRK